MSSAAAGPGTGDRAAVVAELTAALGEDVVRPGEPVRDERGLFEGRPAALVLPRDTGQVSTAVRICAAHRTPVVPQGGGTGLVGGAVPRGDGQEIAIALGRMNRVRRIDPAAFCLEVEAGCVLADVQAAARGADRLFPLSLASEGSCQIGGNIATNAGGMNVLRYGSTRDLVLGLEVVLPDGRVWNGLRSLVKDNTGYSLKHLFAGSEGTLGVITAATLRLFPRPRQRMTALLALDGTHRLRTLLPLARQVLDDRIGSLELLPREGVELVMRHVPGTRDPFPVPHACYVLVEVTSSRPETDLASPLEEFLTRAVREGQAADAVVASDEPSSRRLWALRERLSEAQKAAGGTVKHDVSVPLAAVSDFIGTASRRVTEAFPGARPIALGHIGDGNVHFNVIPPPGGSAHDHRLWREIGAVVHEVVAGMDGSISAEHGIGQLKLAELSEVSCAVELDVRGSVKAALDPQGIMNPGKAVALVTGPGTPPAPVG